MILTVRDTGVGMPKDPAAMKPGLGTGIVEALARQLGASVRVADAPGTKGLDHSYMNNWGHC